MANHSIHLSVHMPIPHPQFIPPPTPVPFNNHKFFKVCVSVSVLRISSLTEEWIKMWYTYTMKYYSVIKNNEIMSFAATWIEPEIKILSEVDQTVKDSII